MLNPTGANPVPSASGASSSVSALPQALAGLPAGSPVSATVVGREGPGQWLMRTAAGMALVASPLKLERGATVKLRVRHGQSPHLSLESVAAKPAAQPGLGASLTADLNAALSHLGKAGTGAATAGAGSGVFSEGGLANAVLAYLAALKGADFAGWFGAATIKALESQGHSKLVSRLAEAFNGQYIRTEGEWQAVMVPFFGGDTVRQLRFFFRRHNSYAGNDSDNRFVVEVETSRMGALQLDGLIKTGRFDLVLRSHQPLAVDARRDIAEIFDSGLAISGRAGSMAFQAMEVFPMPPLDADAGAAGQGFLV